MASSPYRMPQDDAQRLIEAEWAPHERKMYKNAKLRPGSPPRWATEVEEHPDGGPSDTAYARLNKNRVRDAVDRDPSKELDEINKRLAEDQFRLAPAEGDGTVTVPKQADPSLWALWRRSEMRTPLVVPASLLHSSLAALEGIRELAAMRGTEVVTLQQATATEREVEEKLSNALDYGKWVVITRDRVETAPHGEQPGWFIFRHIARQCFTVFPDAENFPKRELFRLWVIIPEPVDLNDTNYPAFPVLFLHQALQLCPVSEDAGGQGSKVVRKLPADPQLLEDECRHRQQRIAQGRDEDGESLEGDVIENSCSARKVTGPIFVRSREMQVHTSPVRSSERLAFAKML
eukprot:TRINITY_DN21188_c0_g1_i1.p1 TRINITY_DN21188_c0_g1~~TRINITY_DN21188_c0_g1_i1.p1  ORF type:complete len:376 (+),score=108.93 TRINITY_DN21188_c0_g1_i1:88-1128(+)